MRALMPEIEAFAEIGEYIDEPVRIYSSGMQMRLAFSVATAVRPDILIVDEALSVGDAYFQHKSFDRIRRFKREGTTLLFVSHGMQDVRVLCDRVILLDQGRVLKDGQPDEVVDYYNAMIAAREDARAAIEQERGDSGWLVTRSGTGEASVSGFSLLDADTRAEVKVARVGQQLVLAIEVKVIEIVPALVLGCMIRDRTGHVVWGTNSWHTGQQMNELESGEIVRFEVTFPCNLGPGSYAVTHALTLDHTHVSSNYEWVDNALVFDVVNADRPLFVGTTFLDTQFSISRQ